MQSSGVIPTVQAQASPHDRRGQTGTFGASRVRDNTWRCCLSLRLGRCGVVRMGTSTRGVSTQGGVEYKVEVKVIHRDVSALDGRELFPPHPSIKSREYAV